MIWIKYWYAQVYKALATQWHRYLSISQLSDLRLFHGPKQRFQTVSYSHQKISHYIVKYVQSHHIYMVSSYLHGIQCKFSTILTYVITVIRENVLYFFIQP